MTLASGGMIFFGLFLIGGVISFFRQGFKVAAVVTGAVSALAITAGVLWWQ
ncbi:hypothetical protein [Acrocarpospora catenulata]|uniref:hypothetical protein n=1 Tax=Acrocarpospora catenulata TaxID=2836182 RepID=UPI001BD9EF88|nr:hypothetical protein [Acrocarpospora catenulata]